MCCFSLISESIVELKKKSGGDADVKTDSNKRIKNKTEVIAQSKLLQRNQAVVRNSEVRKWRAHLPCCRTPRWGKTFPKTPFKNGHWRWKIIGQERKPIKRTRPYSYSFRVNERERKLIDEKVKLSGLQPDGLSDTGTIRKARHRCSLRQRNAYRAQTTWQQPEPSGKKLLLRRIRQSGVIVRC